MSEYHTCSNCGEVSQQYGHFDVSSGKFTCEKNIVSPLSEDLSQVAMALALYRYALVLERAESRDLHLSFEAAMSCLEKMGVERPALEVANIRGGTFSEKLLNFISSVSGKYSAEKFMIFASLALGVSEEDIREVLWRLIEMGRVDLTSDRKIASVR